MSARIFSEVCSIETHRSSAAFLSCVKGCGSSLGKSVSASGKRRWILGRRVRAPISAFGDASQAGTILCASTSMTGISTAFNSSFFHRSGSRNGEKSQTRAVALIFCKNAGKSFLSGSRAKEIFSTCSSSLTSFSPCSIN